jgi:hypothetical protein
MDYRDFLRGHGGLAHRAGSFQLSAALLVNPWSPAHAVPAVALVGYESVTIMITDPNITEYKQWWAPKGLPSSLKMKTKPGECEEAKLPLNAPLRTNSSLPLFSYSERYYCLHHFPRHLELFQRSRITSTNTIPRVHCKVFAERHLTKPIR